MVVGEGPISTVLPTLLELSLGHFTSPRTLTLIAALSPLRYHHYSLKPYIELFVSLLSSCMYPASLVEVV